MRTVTKDWLENGDDHGFYLIGGGLQKGNIITLPLSALQKI